MSTVPDQRRHSRLDDGYAMLIGTSLVALGLDLLHGANLATGGIAGLALLVSYVVPLSPGKLLVLLNLPFYALAWVTLGPKFTVRTIVVSVLILLALRLMPMAIGFSHVDPLYAALFGGTVAGMGILVLARHRAGVGGVGVLALWLQEKRGLRAGNVQMAADALIVSATLLVLPPLEVLLSAASAVALSLVLTINHRPGRYEGY